MGANVLKIIIIYNIKAIIGSLFLHFFQIGLIITGSERQHPVIISISTVFRVIFYL